MNERKFNVRFGPDDEQEYTYLVHEDIAELLNPGDFVIVPAAGIGHSAPSFRIAEVMGETFAPLKPGIRYRKISARLNTDREDTQYFLK